MSACSTKTFTIISGLKDHLGFQSPVDRLITIKREARDLERFLMDSFQLLMSSISVLETQRGAEQALISIEQAARTTRLTQLAFIYVPLTFVTSIFGMNVKEISEPLPPLWVCFVTLAVVAAGTAALLGGIELFIIRKKTTGDNWAAKGNLMLTLTALPIRLEICSRRAARSSINASPLHQCKQYQTSAARSCSQELNIYCQIVQLLEGYRF